jgi:ribosomal protein L37AE/L43A
VSRYKHHKHGHDWIWQSKMAIGDGHWRCSKCNTLITASQSEKPKSSIKVVHRNKISADNEAHRPILSCEELQVLNILNL